MSRHSCASAEKRVARDAKRLAIRAGMASRCARLSNPNARTHWRSYARMRELLCDEDLAHSWSVFRNGSSYALHRALDKQRSRAIFPKRRRRVMDGRRTPRCRESEECRPKWAWPEENTNRRFAESGGAAGEKRCRSSPAAMKKNRFFCGSSLIFSCSQAKL